MISSGFSQRTISFIIFGLLLLNLALRVAVALKPIEHVDDVTIPDDAYLSLTIARNIAEGNGPLYGNGYTNGFQPLYVFLMVPVFSVQPQSDIIPIHFALYLLILFDTIALYLLIQLVRRISASPYTSFIIAVAWIFNPMSIRVALNGLETSIASLFIVWIISYVQRYIMDKETLTTRRIFTFGIIAGLGVMARIDILLLLAPLFGMLAWEWRTNVPSLIKHFAFIFLGMALAYGPWLMYSYWYTGDLYPISGKAVRFMELQRAALSSSFFDWQMAMLRRGFFVFINNNITILVIGGLLFIPIISAGSSFINRLRQQFSLVAVLFISTGVLYCVHVVYIVARWSYDLNIQPMGILTIVGGGLFYILPLLRGSRCIAALGRNSQILIPVFLYAVTLFLAYVFYIYGIWYFERYLHPITIVVLLFAIPFFDTMMSILPSSRKQVGALIASVCIIIAMNCSDDDFRRLYEVSDIQRQGYLKLGRWASTAFTDNTIIGSCQTGALGYFARNITVINLDGVVNKESYDALINRKSISYIRSKNIQYVIGWDLNTKFLERLSDEPFTLEPRPDPILNSIESWEHQWFLYAVR
ncbi:MAG: hypothetical protein WCW40_08985 [Bacteroidota bacterium]